MFFALLFAGRAVGFDLYEVSAKNPLDSVALKILSSPDAGLHVVAFNGYQGVGTFDLEGLSNADTVQFQRDAVSDSVIEVAAGKPFITVRNWKGTLRLRNLAFHLAPAAVLIDGNGSGTTEPGTLILDSCLIFADTLGSNAMQWAADTSGGRHIEIKRSYIAAGRGAGAQLTLSGTTIAFFNNVLNFSGVLQPTVSKNFIFANNTVCRMQINAGGSFATGLSPTQGQYSVIGNLVAQRPGKNYLGAGATASDFMAFTNFNDSGSVLKGNVIYNQWSFDYPSNTRFSADTSNHAISAYAQPDTTELWNWGLTGDAGHGFLAGDSARPIPFNVFPNVTDTALTLPDNTPAILSFDSARIPRTLRPAFTGGLSPDTAFPADRFVWSGKPALTLGGPFQLKTLTLGGQSLQDGNPVLFTNGGASGFTAQAEGVMNAGSATAEFTNQTAAATAFHAAYRCNTSRGTNIAPTYEMGFTAGSDTLNFGSVSRAGRSLWAATTINGWPGNIRSLNRTIGYTTTALLAAGAKVLIGTRQFTAPDLPDSVKYRDATTNALYPALDSSGWLLARIPTSSSSFAVYAVEHLSVPRGDTSTLFSFSWGQVRAVSDSGFQLQLDTVSKSQAVDTTKFAYGQKPVAVTWQGKGPHDSIQAVLNVTPDLELWKIPVGGVPVPDTTAARSGNTVQINIAAADSAVAFFSGLSLNVPAPVFTGIVNGFEVDTLRSSISLRLTLGRLDTANADTVAPVRNMRFLGGVSIAMRHAHLTSSYALRFAVSKPMDVDSAQAWVYSAGLGWKKISGLAFSSGHDTAQVGGLDATMTAILVMEAIGPPVGITPKFAFKSSSQVEVTNQSSAGGAVTQYRVVTYSVDALGHATTQTSGLTPLDSALDLSLDTLSYHAFTIQYYVGNTLAAVLVQGALPGLTVSKSVQDAAFPPTLQQGWQLVSLPINDTLLQKEIVTVNPLDTDTVDTKHAYRLKEAGSIYSWDTTSGFNTVTVHQGQAVLFGGTRIYTLQLTASVAPTLQPFTLTDTAGGWRLIGNPFPFAFPLAKVTSNLGALTNLERLTASGKASQRAYAWVVVGDSESLQPFGGYAYFFQPGETLTFDPLAASAAAKTSAAKSAAATPPGLSVSAQIQGVDVSAHLYPASRGDDIPVLPVPGLAYGLRLGGNPGWWSQGVEWGGFETPLILTAPQGGMADLSAAGSALPAAVVWDSLSGEAYDLLQPQRLALRAGDNRLTLIGGSIDYVAARLGALQSIYLGAGRFSISVLPNALHWRLDLPARSGGYDWVTLSLQDIQGRRIRETVFGRTAAGTLQGDWDLRNLHGGIYISRVQAGAGGGVVFRASQKEAAP